MATPNPQLLQYSPRYCFDHPSFWFSVFYSQYSCKNNLFEVKNFYCLSMSLRLWYWREVVEMSDLGTLDLNFALSTARVKNEVDDWLFCIHCLDNSLNWRVRILIRIRTFISWKYTCCGNVVMSARHKILNKTWLFLILIVRDYACVGWTRGWIQIF